MIDIGISCQKDSYGRGVGKVLTCTNEQEMDLGICSTAATIRLTALAQSAGVTAQILLLNPAVTCSAFTNCMIVAPQLSSRTRQVVCKWLGTSLRARVLKPSLTLLSLSATLSTLSALPGIEQFLLNFLLNNCDRKWRCSS